MTLVDDTLAGRLARPDSSLRRAMRDLLRPDQTLMVRFVEQSARDHHVERGAVLPLALRCDAGVMITVMLAGGIGYCATPDLSTAGLREAAARAREWALASRACGLFDGLDWQAPPGVARRGAPLTRAAASGEGLETGAIVALLRHEADACRIDPRIVDWSASLAETVSRQWLFVQGDLLSDLASRFVEPNLSASARDGQRTQTRSLGGQYNGFCQQGGREVVDRSGLAGAGRRVAGEALELLEAPNCPSGRMSVLLAPDQMMLQIHESIGHPLELDRILGDERNFAGTSFVTPEMFGTYRYGSPLLNVCFDPIQPHGFASMLMDDEGMIAERQWLIRDGVLQRPLGSALSQWRIARDGYSLASVANARACGWHRAPIDRMGNVNLAPGDASWDELIGAVDHGVLMRTNVSWSIDDSRNKFQFGCEWGQLIENGRLTRVVRNPNYRGVSASFWRSLSRVGDASTMEVMGTPFCGKGEPGQVIRVGHSSPACLFDDVDVFGAAS